MLSSIRKMYGIYKIMKKITLIIMEGAQFDQSTVGLILIESLPGGSAINLLF